MARMMDSPTMTRRRNEVFPGVTLLVFVALVAIYLLGTSRKERSLRLIWMRLPLSE